MKLTPEKITELKRMYAEVDSLSKASSEAILFAKEHKGRKVKVKRKDGKEVETTEGALWEEVRFLQQGTEGYAILEKKYPKAFSLADEQRKKAEELSVYVRKELDIDVIRLRLIDVIEITEAVWEMKHKEVKEPTKKKYYRLTTGGDMEYSDTYDPVMGFIGETENLKQ